MWNADIHAVGNAIEAGLWWLLALVLLAVALFTRKSVLPALRVSLVLAAFGFSDLVEIRTGAWWRPGWLLAWKAICVLLLVWELHHHVRRNRSS